MADGQRKWEEKTLLVATVVGALAAVLALLPVRELHPLFELFGLTVPLWILVAVVILAVSVPGIIRKRTHGYSLSEDTSERLKKLCNFKIDEVTRIEGPGANQFVLSGKYDQWPPAGFNVWLITTPVGGSRPKYWPQGEINRSAVRNEWDARVGLGAATRQGEEMRVILAIVRDCGQILFTFYLGTEDPSRRGHKLPLPLLPNDVIPCDDRTLLKK